MLLSGTLTRANYVLIDYENVQIKSLELLEDDHFKVRVFIGPKNCKLHKDLVLTIQRMRDRADYIEMEGTGANALDFHIAYYLGVLATTEPTSYFHIISKDTGFDPLIQHLREKRLYITRSNSIEEMPCFVTSEIIKENPTIIKIEVTASTTKNGKAVQKVEELFRSVFENLSKRKTGRPRTVKTLKSTIKSISGKETTDSAVDSVYSRLLKDGYAKVNGEKITYHPPST